MTANVIEFRKPSPAGKATHPAAMVRPVRLADINERQKWLAALAAIWANPRNWRTSRLGNRYIVIDDLDICVVISRHEDGTGFKWEIRWRWGREPTKSKWIYMAEQAAIDEAWTAVAALA